ncbi:DUF2971 domain-containing protein [Azospirillum sp.]|uniref:DUF2971 domain-containing protein n=1 Tax=Azospirillum sp. TaxID=34012 RepID=UPI003D72D376
MKSYQNKWKVRRSEIPFTTSKFIYHYTDLFGFKGIVESKGVWASHIRYMNDAEEVLHGRRLALRVLSWLAQKPEYSSFSDVLKRVIDNINRSNVPDYYIACFSRRGDSLDQWRGYCQNGGVSIEFSLLNMHPFMILPVLRLSDVIYSDYMKARRIILKIKRYAYEFEMDKMHYGEEFPRYIDEQLEEYAKHLLLSLEYMFLTFKNNAFNNEHEVTCPHVGHQRLC